MQKIKCNKGDWYELLQIERMENHITQTDEQIASMSREQFKNIVDSKVTSHAVKYLNELAEPHSKSDFIVDDKF